MTTQPSINLPAYPRPGDVIDGKYQIEKMLGEGGMGAVVRATHLLRRAPVALKFMSPQVMSFPGAVDRFLNEAIAASQIDCENVVKIFDVGTLPSGAPYLVMECMSGEDLSDLLSREGKPGLADAQRCIHFVLQVLRALQIAHSVGIVHRDMKPSNCFVIQKDGEPDFVKLLDFGISKVQQASGGRVTHTNSVLGTPLYMSPEQAKSAKRADARSDLYAVGVIFFELLTGRTPYMSETGEFGDILLQIFTAEPPQIKSFRPDIPDGLAAIIHKSFARDPAERYQTAAEMADALVPWADERSRQIILSLRRRAATTGEIRTFNLQELGSQAKSFRTLGPNGEPYPSSIAPVTPSKAPFAATIATAVGVPPVPVVAPAQAASVALPAQSAPIEAQAQPAPVPATASVLVATNPQPPTRSQTPAILAVIIATIVVLSVLGVFVVKRMHRTAQAAPDAGGLVMPMHEVSEPGIEARPVGKTEVAQMPSAGEAPTKANAPSAVVTASPVTPGSAINAKASIRPNGKDKPLLDQKDKDSKKPRLGNITIKD